MKRPCRIRIPKWFRKFNLARTIVYHKTESGKVYEIYKRTLFGKWIPDYKKGNDIIIWRFYTTYDAALRELHKWKDSPEYCLCPISTARAFIF
jgi:hypothetical protein